MLWTPEGIKAVAKEYDTGLRKIQAQTWNSKTARTKAIRELGRKCWGSRGSTKAHNLMTDSVLQFCVDGLHAKNNWSPLTFRIMYQQWVSFGVLRAVQKAAGRELGALFTKTAQSAKRDTYSIDGNLWSKFILRLPTILGAILSEARRLDSVVLLRL